MLKIFNFLKFLFTKVVIESIEGEKIIRSSSSLHDVQSIQPPDLSQDYREIERFLLQNLIKYVIAIVHNLSTMFVIAILYRVGFPYTQCRRRIFTITKKINMRIMLRFDLTRAVMS